MNKLTINQIYFVIAPALILGCDVIFRDHSFGYYAKGGWALLALIGIVSFITCVVTAHSIQKSSLVAIGNGLLGALVAIAATRITVIVIDFVYQSGYGKHALIALIGLAAILAYCFSSAGDPDSSSGTRPGHGRMPRTPKPDEDDAADVAPTSNQKTSPEMVGRIGGPITLF